MYLLKREAEALGEQVVSAAVGEVVALTVSAAAGKHDAGARVADQLERLDTLVAMLHSAVDAAEGVHIRSWWLRRWLWRLRDAALDGGEVLRSCRQRLLAEPRQAAGANTLWNTARRVLRSAKSSMLAGGNGGDKDDRRRGRTLARLEGMATGIGDFLKLLELEIRRTLPARPVLTQSSAGSEEPRRSTHDYGVEESFYCSTGSSIMFTPIQGDDVDRGSCDSPIMQDTLLAAAAAVPQPARLDGTISSGGEDASVVISSDADEPPTCTTSGPPSASISRDGHLSTISHQEYISSRTRIGLLIVRHKLRRAMDRVRAAVAPAPPAASLFPTQRDLDLDRLWKLVYDIRQAARTCEVPEVNAKVWLARWLRHLQAVADNMGADSIVALAVAQARGDETFGDETNVREVLTAVRNVEAAAASLEAFLTLVRIATMPNA